MEILVFSSALVLGILTCRLFHRKPKTRQDDIMDVAAFVPHLLCVHDLKTNLLHFNNRWSEYAGHEPKGELGFFDEIHPEDQPLIELLYRNAVEKKIPFAFEYRVRRHDHLYRWHLVRGEFVFAPDGDCLKCVSTSTDIHDQKTAEAEKAKLLREVEAKTSMLTAVIDQMPMGVVIAGPNRNIISQNKRMAEFFHLGKEHRVGKLQGFHADGSPIQETEWVILRALATGTTEQMEFHTPADEFHGPRIFHSLASPVFAPNGEIAGAVSIIEDITEYRKKALVHAQASAAEVAAAEIRKSEKFLADLVDNIPHLIFMKDAESLQYINANRACLEIFDPNGPGPIGKTSHEIYTREQADQVVLSDLEAIRTNAVVDLPRHSLTVGTKGLRYFQTKKFVVEGREGKKVIVGISSDITDIVEAEKKMILAKEQAETVARMKSEFLANMSHEIRTPLNGVIGMTELILEGNLESGQRNFVHMVRDSGNALLSIVNDILDFSKVESGHIELEMLEFEIRTTFTSHLEMMKVRAKTKEIELAYGFDSKLPELVRGDSNRIAQVLNNLIGNAIKFTEPGGRIDIKAELSAQNGDDTEIRFSVADTGIGLTKEEQEKLFRPFVQGDGSMARKYGGTGLGLSICKRLVQLMGGNITIESVKGAGSTFVVIVHLKKADVAGIAERAEVMTTQDVSPLSAVMNTFEFKPIGKHVLLVEDNEINQILVLSLLNRMGYTVDTAKNGLEAVEAYARRNYDAILMDCQMPELDGYQATMRIREREKATGHRIPVIALTANARNEDRDRCLAVDMDDFISKPLKRDSLEKVLQKWTQAATAS